MVMGKPTNAAKLAEDKAFRGRVTATVVTCAWETLLDPSSDIRARDYSRTVIQGPTTYTEAFSWSAATDPEIAALDNPASVADDLLLARIRLRWRIIAAGPG
jgi:hypothetical protein